MAYDKTVPSASNNWEDDLTAMAENFTWLRRHFLNGVIPIDGSYIEYTYDTDGNVSGAKVYDSAATELASVTYTYDTSGQLTDEDWSVDGKTYNLDYTWSSGNVTKVTIAIA